MTREGIGINSHSRFNSDVNLRGFFELLDEDLLLGDLGPERLDLTLLLVERDLGRVLLRLRDLVLEREVPLQHRLPHFLFLEGKGDSPCLL